MQTPRLSAGQPIRHWIHQERRSLFSACAISAAVGVVGANTFAIVFVAFVAGYVFHPSQREDGNV